MIRLLGRRPGVTDLSITTAESQTFSFEIHVTWDLTMLQIQLKHMFPDAEIRLSQMRDHIVVEGQALQVRIPAIVIGQSGRS
jgi:Flp pilus assembly secretin CpaC